MINCISEDSRFRFHSLQVEIRRIVGQRRSSMLVPLFPNTRMELWSFAVQRRQQEPLRLVLSIEDLLLPCGYKDIFHLHPFSIKKEDELHSACLSFIRVNQNYFAQQCPDPSFDKLWVRTILPPLSSNILHCLSIFN